MSYRDFDFEEEGRDDVIRQEIEAVAQDEKDFWDAIAASWAEADMPDPNAPFRYDS